VVEPAPISTDPSAATSADEDSVAATAGVSHPFQVLALDGGGIKGLFSAAVLAAIEADLGTVITNHFDLIVGTSTGGIIALALGAGIRPREVVSLYTGMASHVFAGARRRAPLRLVRRKFSNAPLRDSLIQSLRDRALWESLVPLVIPAYDLTSDQVHLFKTPHHPRLRRDWPLKMVDVAMATSAAPTYLPSWKVDGVRLVDGGVWANNPVLVGIAEAVSVFGARLEDVRVLSLGTTEDLVGRHRRLDRGGLVQWANSAVPVVLRGQSIGAQNIAYHLIGDRLVRIDERVPANSLRIDRADPDALFGLASSLSRQRMPAIEPFSRHTATPLRPFHRPGQEPLP
jgi:patatin-like phospholipase/acyl hydrolase